MRNVQIDSKALMRAGASRVLALDERVFASGVMLRAEAPKPLTEDKVAIVTVAGPLAQRAFADLCGYVDGYDTVSARFAAALSDPEVGAVILRIDSPGGDVAGLEEAVSAMRKARDASGKRVIAFVDELAASAAFWIASSVAHEIVAPASAIVGSIGVIGALVDETKALEQEGLKITLIREPAGKAEGHPAGPVSALAEERATELVKSAATRFYAAVSAARGIEPKDVKALNGAVFEAPKALAKGLIDSVGGFDLARTKASDAIAARKRQMTDQEKAAAKAAADDKIAATARALTGKDSPDAVIGALHALAQSAGRVVEIEKAEKAKAEKQSADEKTALIASLQKNRQIVKTQVAWAESMSLESLKAFAEATPSQAPETVVDAKDNTAIVVVDPDLERELAKLGMTKAEYAATKAEMTKAGVA